MKQGDSTNAPFSRSNSGQYAGRLAHHFGAAGDCCRLEVHLNTSDLNKEADKLNRSIEWLTIALLLGGMMGGSAIAVSIPTSIGSVPLSTVAFFAFMTSILLSAVLVVRLIWQR